MKKFCYLKIEDIKRGEKEIFKPLEGREFEELLESIKEYGIIFPLVVKKDTDGKFTILSGHNRYRAAGMLGMPELPCMIEEDDELAVGAIFDTNLYKRELPREAKKYYVAARAKMKEEIAEKTIKEKLIPEIAELFRKGSLTLEVVKTLSCYSKEQQEQVMKVFKETEKVYTDDEEVLRLERELKKSKEEALRLKETLSDRESKLKELRLKEDKAKELLVEKLSQLDKAKENAGEEVRKEYEKEIKELQKNLQDLSKVIKQKNEEIETVKEEKEKAERMQDHRQAEVNAVLMKMREYRDTCRDFLKKYSNPKIVLNRFDNVIAELDTLVNHIIQFQWDEETADLADKKAEEIINKVKKAVKNLRENVADEVVNPSGIGK